MQALVVPAEQHAFGQLQHQRRRGETGLGQHPAHAVDEAGVAELARGHVDAGVKPGGGGHLGADLGRYAAPPPCDLAGRLPEDPGTERDDVPGLLGQLDELVGLHHPPLRVRPAHQRLEPGDRAAGQGDNRLVDEGEPGVVDRFLQRGLYLPAADHARAEHRGVPAPLPLARRLGRVQGQVGVPEQLVHVGAVLGGGHADRGGGHHRPVGQLERLAERPDHPLGEGLHPGRVGQVLHQQRELVAAEPGRGVGLPHDLGQPDARRHQELVADAVPHGVVGHLEVVQVHEQDPGHRALTPGPDQRVGRPVLEQQPVGQPGERVVEGPVLELGLELTLLGDVPHREHQAGHGAVLPQVTAPHLALDLTSVPAGDLPVLGVGAVPGVPAQPGQRPQEAVPVAVGGQFPQVGALGADVTEHAGRGRGGVPDQAVVGDDQDHVRGVLDQRAEVGLAALADDLPAEHDALDRQRRLVGQDLERGRQTGQGPGGAEHGQHSDQRVSGRPVRQGQRAEQSALGPGQQAVGVRAELGLGQENRVVAGEPGQPGLGQPAQLIRVVGGRDRVEVPVVAHQEQRVVGPAGAGQIGGGTLHGRRRLGHGGRRAE